MKIVHARAVIEVPDGTMMGGYVDRVAPASGTLDPLELHAVLFEAGTDRFALIALDLVSVGTDLTAAVRSELAGHGIDAAWVAATHTHSGPAAGTRPGGGGSTPKALVGEVLRALRSAVAAWETAEVATTVEALRVWVDGVGGPRNHADSTSPVPVDALAIRDHDRLLGLILVVPIHATVLGAENCRISADLHGGIRRALVARAGGWAVCLTGAAGDISTRYQRRGQTSEEIDRLSDRLVEAVGAALSADDAPVQRPDGAGAAGTIVGPRAMSVSVATRRDDDLERLLAELGARRATTPGRAETVLRHGAQIAEQLRQRSWPATIDLDLEVVRLDGISLVALPCEPFLDVGEAIAAGVGDTIVIGYANGYLGYLPTDPDDLSYEVLSSPFGAGAADQVIAAARGLVTELDAMS